MPARIVVVLNEPGFADRVTTILAGRGYDAVSLPDSMVALTALEGAQRVELLLTCMDYEAGKPNGISLARMARMRKPGIKVAFVGEPAMAHFTAGLGDLLTSPVTVLQVVDWITEMTEAPERPSRSPEYEPG